MSSYVCEFDSTVLYKHSNVHSTPIPVYGGLLAAPALNSARIATFFTRWTAVVVCPVGVSNGTSTLVHLVHGIRLGLELNPSYVAVKLDLANGFNATSCVDLLRHRRAPSLRRHRRGPGRIVPPRCRRVSPCMPHLCAECRAVGKQVPTLVVHSAERPEPFSSAVRIV